MFLVDKIKTRIIKDKNLILKLIKTAFSRCVSAFGTLVFNFALAKCLNVTDFGHFMLAYSILVGLGFFARWGMPTAIIRFAGIMFADNEFGQIKKLRRDVLLRNLVATSILGLLLILARSFLSDHFFEKSNVSGMLFVFAMALPFYSYQTIQSSFFKAFKKPEIAPYFEIGLTTFLTGASVALITFYGLHVDGFIVSICFFFSSMLITVLGFFTLSKLIETATKGKKYHYENYSGFYSSLNDYGLSAITGYLLKFSPAIFLGLFATGKDVGLYSLANSIAFVINFVSWIVNTVYSPHFAHCHKQNKIAELRGLYISSTFYMALIAVPVFLLIIAFPSFFLNFFGHEYAAAKTALIIMAFAQLFNVLTGQVYALLNMTGHERKMRNIVLFTAITSIVLSLILIPYWGYVGAAIATATGLVLQNSLAFYFSKKYLEIDFITVMNLFKSKQK